MKIVAGALFLGLSLFLNSIELSKQSGNGSSSSATFNSRVPVRSSLRTPSQELTSSHPKPQRAQHTTLEKLFPGSKGVHFPDIEVLSPARVVNYPNIKILNGRKMLNAFGYTTLKRGHVIFGYRAVNNIKPLSPLFGHSNLYAVFNTEDEQWYTVSFGELQKLGVGRYLPFVLAHDEAHSVEHNRNHQVNSEAHDAASKAAYPKTRDYEETVKDPSCEQQERLKEIYSEKDAAESVKKYYHQKYNEAYQIHAGGQERRQAASTSHGGSVD